MQAWEMEKQAKESLFKRLDLYRGKPKETVHTNTQISYDEAKAAGNVGAMLDAKFRAFDEKAKNLVALTNEVYATKSITEIQNSIKELEKSVEKSAETVQLLEQAQERKFRKEYSRIGGLVGIHLDAAVYEAMNEWLSTNEKYLEAVAELKDVKKDYTAHCNAKEIYLEDNKDLIEAEREKARRRDLLSSGILEELGITQSEE